MPHLFLRRGPGSFADSTSEGINVLFQECPGDPERVRVINPLACHLTSNPHILAFSGAVVVCAPEGPELREPPSFDIEGEVRVLHDIVYEVLAQGVWTHPWAPLAS